MAEKQQYDDELLIRYLLHELPEEETERLDEMSIADDDFALQLRAAENDLVDSYVRGLLAADKSERFRSAYLSSDEGRRKVRFAEALVRERAPRRRVSFRWAMAAAATVALIVAGYVAFVNRRPAVPIAKSVLRSPSKKAEPKTATFVLMAQLRGAGEVPNVVVPRGTERVAFKLQLESDDFPEYQVALRNPATTQIVWRSDRVKKNGGSVKVLLSVEVLANGNLTLELSGIPANGSSVFVSSYTFRVALE